MALLAMDKDLGKNDLTDEELEAEIKKLDFSNLRHLRSNTEQAGIEKKEEVKLPPSSLPASKFQTNLERYHYYCKDLPSCDLYIDFSFYFAIAACLARRVWTGGDEPMSGLFPNLYPIFVSKPGIGKSKAAEPAALLLNSLVETKKKKDGGFVETRLVNMGPDAITFEKLIIRMSDSTESDRLLSNNNKIYQHSSTTFCLSDEIQMLFNENAGKVMAVLNTAYDCRKLETDTIKHGVIPIKNVCVNFLGCTNPDVIRKLMKMGVMETGFTGRALFIFSDKKRTHPPRIVISQEQNHEFEHIRRHLRKLCKLKPRNVPFTKEADMWLEHWHYKEQDIHLNNNPKLEDYYARKKVHILKLAMCHAFHDRADNEVVVDVKDLIAASKLLLRAEPLMHKALAGGGDNHLHDIAEDIKKFLQERGPTSIKKLMLNFFQLMKNGGGDLVEVVDYLVTTEQCSRCQVDGGKEGLKIKKASNEEDKM